MKKIILIVITCFIIQVDYIYSQTEFASIGAEWHYSEPNAGYTSDYDYDYQKYISEKDTIIEGKTCRLITNRFYPSEIIYEESGSVYYYYLDDFRKIFDFAANEGDTLDFEFKVSNMAFWNADTVITLQCIVESIITDIIDEMPLRIFHTTILKNEDLNHLFLPDFYNYTEKIGYTSSIRFNEFFPFIEGPEPAIYGYRNLRCYSDDDIDYIASWWEEKNKPCDEPFSLSIKNYETNDLINIFPNPAKDELKVQFSENSNIEKISISIYDKIGKLVFEKDYSYEQTINIDIQNFTSGYYSLKISNKNNIVLTHKFIKL